MHMSHLHMSHSRVLPFSIAMPAGAAIWALSPLVGGHAEPWDGGLYYSAALILAGLVATLVAPGPLWALYIGCIAGQVLFVLMALPLEPLLLVGLGFLLAWSLLFLASAWLCIRVCRWLVGAP